MNSPLQQCRGFRFTVVMKTLKSWSRRWDERHRLLRLDPGMLSAYGLRREQWLREAGKPFWRA